MLEILRQMCQKTQLLDSYTLAINKRNAFCLVSLFSLFSPLLESAGLDVIPINRIAEFSAKKVQISPILVVILHLGHQIDL